MAEQRLNTRIISKHITLDQANNGTWAPFEGEIVLARVDTQKPDGHGGVTVVPTYLMKVGAKDAEGNLIAIKDLQWAHAPASDVFAWAKQEKLGIVDTEVGNVITGIEATDAGITIHRASVATSESYEEVLESIDALEKALAQEVTDRGEADTALDDKITAINDNLNGTTEGGIGARLTAVEGVASGAASKADTVDNDLQGYKTTVTNALATKVDADTYNAKMTEIDEETADIRADFAEADTAVKTELKGTAADGKDAETIAGAKAFATEEATAKAAAAQEAAENTAAGALSAAKTELEGKITEVSENLETLATSNATAHEGFTNKISALEEKVANVANVMDFIGVREVTVTTTGEGESEVTVITVVPVDGETFNTGDVVVDSTGREYVYDGSAWHEFGYADGNTAAIEALQGELAAFEQTVSDTYVTNDEFTALDQGYEDRFTTLEKEVNGYTEGETEVKGLRTLIAEEALRADTAEKANAEAIKAISDDYLKGADKTELEEATAAVADDLATLSDTVTQNKADVDTNFVKVVDGKLTVGGNDNVIIFDCGGAE